MLHFRIWLCHWSWRSIFQGTNILLQTEIHCFKATILQFRPLERQSGIVFVCNSLNIHHIQNCSNKLCTYIFWLGYGLDDRVQFPAQAMMGLFLLATASRQDLEPTQTPIKWVPGVLSLGIMWLGQEAGQSPQSSGEVKSVCRAISLLPQCIL